MSKGEKQAGRPQLRALEREGTPDRTSTTLSIAAAQQSSSTAAAARPAAASGATSAAAPDPEVVERPVRRTFTGEFKRSIVEQADACREAGAVGELLRRHGLYSSHLVEWRAQYRRGALSGLAPRKRGPKTQPKNPLAEKLARLERENARLQKRLQQAETIIDFQKKVAELLGIPLKRPDSDGND